MNANNHPKLRERRFLNATLIYFKISIANVAIVLCHGGVPTKMAASVMVGPLFSLYLYYVPYLCMYVKVTSVESRAVGLTLKSLCFFPSTAPQRTAQKNHFINPR